MEKQIKKMSQVMAYWMGTPSSFLWHTAMFIAAIVSCFFFKIEVILLVVTTLVSLEAIYQNIFLQMIVNEHQEKLRDVTETIGEIQESVEEVSESVEEVQEMVEDEQKEEVKK